MNHPTYQTKPLNQWTQTDVADAIAAGFYLDPQMILDRQRIEGLIEKNNRLRAKKR